MGVGEEADISWTGNAPGWGTRKMVLKGCTILLKFTKKILKINIELQSYRICEKKMNVFFIILRN